MQVINPHSEVLFVGAGPVALFTAIQAKLLKPEIEIGLVERFDEYVRKQTLSINPSAFKNLCDLKRIKKQHPAYARQIDTFAQLILDIKTHKKIRINLIEKRLRSIAEDLNIAIHRNYTFHSQEKDEKSNRDLIGIQSLKEAFPKAKIIVGSDGAHSRIREAVFHNDLKVDEGLQYTIAIRYWVKNESLPLGKLTTYRAHKVVGFTQEHVGKYDTEKKANPITVQFFIDHETFEKFKDYKAGNPLAFKEIQNIDPAVREKILMWLALRREKLGDILEEAIEVYSIKLPIYQSRHAVHQEDGLIFCLVGDAFFGVPFFQSIKNGFLCGSRLSQAIVQTLYPQPYSLLKRIQIFVQTILTSAADAEWQHSPLKHYATYGDKLAKSEIRWARVKNFILKSYQWLVSIHVQMPWKVSFQDTHRFNEFNDDPYLSYDNPSTKRCCLINFC